MSSIIPTLVYVSIVAYSYVFSLHIKAVQGYRDDPIIIIFRTKRIALVTIANLLLAPFVLVHVLKTVPDVKSVFRILGILDFFHLEVFSKMLKTLFLFMMLFSGPLLDRIVNQEYMERYSSTIEMLRDLLIAPLTEEFVYTSLTTGSILAYELSKKPLAYLATPYYSSTEFHNKKEFDIYLKLSPILFGFAHLHHAIELRRQNNSWGQIIITCVFQSIYTTFFGYLTNRVFVNTGSLACCFVAHSFCNYMGFPKLSVSGCNSYKIIYWALLLFGVSSFSSRFDKMTYTATNRM